jgi:hypothetical protein
MPYKDKEVARRKSRERYARDSEVRRKQQEATAAWEASLPKGKWYDPAYGRRKQLERRHKMTVEQYEVQLAEQGGHCALCSAVQGDDKRRMAVDHDHSCCDKELACGKCNRGILCADCNRRVAFLEQILHESFTRICGSPGTWLKRALKYLDSYRD